MQPSPGSPPLLEVNDLVVRFRSGGETVHAVNGIGFTVARGETLAIVGESGSGKTVTVLSILGLVPSPPAEITSGTALFDGEDLLAADQSRLRAIRGARIGVVFQDPMTSLNPVITVGEQIREAIWCHDRHGAKQDHLARVIELLATVGVPEPGRRARQYPHEFSGGMRQRAMIAMAIANGPELLVADEPTTALDVTIQAQIMDVLFAAKESTGAASIIVTHDLGLVSEVADRVIVMYAGRIVESAPTEELFDRPSHPYTIGLLESLPSLETHAERLTAIAGYPPTLTSEPTGCMFRARCFIGTERDRCRVEQPEMTAVGNDHVAACHFVDEVPTWIDRVATA